VTTKKSAIVTNADASPIVKNNARLDGGRVRQKSGTIALLSTDLDAADIIVLARVPGNATINSILLFNDDLDGDVSPLLTIDVGLYKVDGTVVDINFYASAITSFNAAVVGGTQVAFEARNINTLGQAVWQDAASTTDTGIEYDVALTVLAAARGIVAGDISFIVEYTVD